MTVAPLHQAPKGRFLWWFKLIAVTAVLSFLFAYFLLVPVVERLVRSAFDFMEQAPRELLRFPYENACRQFEMNEEVVTMLGLPIVCAPLEAVEWIEPQDGPALEFAFEIRGPLAVGRAHARYEDLQGTLELTNLTVTVDEHTIFLPTIPSLRP